MTPAPLARSKRSVKPEFESERRFSDAEAALKRDIAD